MLRLLLAVFVAVLVYVKYSSRLDQSKDIGSASSPESSKGDGSEEVAEYLDEWRVGKKAVSPKGRSRLPNHTNLTRLETAIRERHKAINHTLRSRNARKRSATSSSASASERLATAMSKLKPTNDSMERVRNLVLQLEDAEDVVILSSATYTYRELAFNWIKHLEDLGIRNYGILCFDERVYRFIGHAHGVLMANSAANYSDSDGSASAANKAKTLKQNKERAENKKSMVELVAKARRRREQRENESSSSGPGRGRGRDRVKSSVGRDIRGNKGRSARQRGGREGQGYDERDPGGDLQRRRLQQQQQLGDHASFGVGVGVGIGTSRQRRLRAVAASTSPSTGATDTDHEKGKGKGRGKGKVRGRGRGSTPADEENLLASPYSSEGVAHLERDSRPRSARMTLQQMKDRKAQAQAQAQAQQTQKQDGRRGQRGQREQRNKVLEKLKRQPHASTGEAIRLQKESLLLRKTINNKVKATSTFYTSYQMAKFDAIHHVLSLGRSVIWSDTDAVWLDRCAYHALIDMPGQVDVAGQRALFPTTLSFITGSCLCGGFFLMRPSPATLALVDSVRKRLLQNEDDQSSLNKALLEAGGLYFGSRQLSVPVETEAEIRLQGGQVSGKTKKIWRRKQAAYNSTTVDFSVLRLPRGPKARNHYRLVNVSSAFPHPAPATAPAPPAGSAVSRLARWFSEPLFAPAAPTPPPLPPHPNTNTIINPSPNRTISLALLPYSLFPRGAVSVPATQSMTREERNEHRLTHRLNATFRALWRKRTTYPVEHALHEQAVEWRRHEHEACLWHVVSPKEGDLKVRTMRRDGVFRMTLARGWVFDGSNDSYSEEDVHLFLYGQP